MGVHAIQKQNVEMDINTKNKSAVRAPLLNLTGSFYFKCRR